MGTVTYMSPEQALGETVDHRTDIWSLGIVLFEMLTGQFPFKGEYDQVVLNSILNKSPQPITGLRSGIPLELEAIVNKCLEKDPTERYQTVADVKADLKRLKRDMTSGKTSAPSAPKVVPHPFPKIFRKIAFPLGGIILVLIFLLLLPSTRQTITHWLGFEAIPESIRLAVLPFTVERSDETDRVFCDGLVETLTYKLTRLEQFQEALWVVRNNQVLELENVSVSEARQSFGINLAVNGSMQQIGDKVQLTLNLVDAKNLRQLRSEDITVANAARSSLHTKAILKLAQMLDIELQPETSNVLFAGGPSVPGAREFYLQGRGYLQRYEKEESLDIAISLFERAIVKDSSYAEAYAGLGEAYWYKYDLTKDSTWIEEARSYCNRAIQINDRLLPVYVTLGIIYRGTGWYESAIKEFEHALKLVPENFDATLELAKTYAELGRLVEAEETYKTAIRYKPSRWAGHSSLGAFYWRYGQLPKAEESFLQVIELTPDNNRGYSNLGAVYINMGRFDLAEPMLVKSIDIKPTMRALTNLGTSYFYQKRYTDAMGMYKTAIEYGDKSYITWANLADTYRHLPTYSNSKIAAEAYQHAIQLAEEQLIINPRDDFLRSRLASYYSMIGNHNKALDEISKALKNSPDDVRILMKSIWVFELAKKRDQALHYLDKLIERGGPTEFIQKDPDLSELRKDPRYQELIKRVDSSQSSSSK